MPVNWRFVFHLITSIFNVFVIGYLSSCLHCGKFLFPDRLYFEHPNYCAENLYIAVTVNHFFWWHSQKERYCSQKNMYWSNDQNDDVKWYHQWASLVHFSFIIMSGSWNFGQGVVGESLLNVPIIHPQNIENFWVFVFREYRMWTLTRNVWSVSQILQKRIF